MCRIEDFLGREEFKEEFRGETDEGDLHLNVQQIFITFYQIFSIRICNKIFILQCLRIKNLNSIISAADKIRSKKSKSVLYRSIFKTMKYKSKSKIVCGCKTRNTIRTNKCSINVDFETNFVEVNRHCFDIARDEPISIHNVSRATNKRDQGRLVTLDIALTR